MPEKKGEFGGHCESDQAEDILFAPEMEDEKQINVSARSSGHNTRESTISEDFAVWKILVADDEEDVHTITSMLFEDVSYKGKPVKILDAYSGAETCQILAEENDIALVFLDVVMETSHAGLEVVRYLRSELGNLTTRLILRTGQPGEAPESKVIMEYEIDDYKLKTELTAQKMLTSLIGGLRSYGTLRSLEYENQRRKQAEMKLLEAYARLDKVFEQTVSSLSSTIGLRDSYTAGHARNVGKLAQSIAQRMGLPPEHCRMLKLAGYLHDIGKIDIPMELLMKKGDLSEEDWAIIRDHPETGYKVLQDIDFPWPLARVVLEHHERCNGEGYPYGKRQDELLLESQILAVADVVEAMMLSRPYREALGKEIAMEEIFNHKGDHYHPEIVDICLQIINEGFDFETN
ncbi:MAG: HD domain-containing protein [Candidatus Cloacimonetes bacterium]|nr:HD domain-containing protein [Candidatus Cloacimonadota bacterium]